MLIWINRDDNWISAGERAHGNVDPATFPSTATAGRTLPLVPDAGSILDELR